MSRVGKNPVQIPSGVEVKFDGKVILVKGKNGELSFEIPQNIELDISEKEITLTRKNEEKETRALHGTARSVINNLVIGVSKGFEKRMEINGVGYRASANGKKITLNLGFSHPVEMTAPDGVKVEWDNDKKNIVVSGADKQKVGQFAAEIREWRKPEPYKGKGIKYVGEYVRRKAGKTAAKK